MNQINEGYKTFLAKKLFNRLNISTDNPLVFILSTNKEIKFLYSPEHFPNLRKKYFQEVIVRNFKNNTSF